jgi:hypothetical protein
MKGLRIANDGVKTQPITRFKAPRRLIECRSLDFE